MPNDLYIVNFTVYALCIYVFECMASHCNFSNWDNKVIWFWFWFWASLQHAFSSIGNPGKIIQTKKVQIKMLFTPPRNRGELYFHCSLTVCLCVCLSVCVCVRLFSCEKNSSRTDTPIWTQFLQNGCLAHWLGLYWN